MKKIGIFLGVILILLGSISVFMGVFELPNYGVYLQGTQAGLAGMSIIICGLWWVFRDCKYK